ncbi:hypothetical protein ACPWT1_10810 [Ramlibacter sp. MMS24-I3-19]|uniref:hypothetical protein n=1 Tax=Ramlibacter sp. MMS24-I3-19 TaxID=3416606 RepID=UPI003CFDC36B
MYRVLALAVACTLLTACSTRALRASDDDLWDGYASTDGAAFLGYHGRVERLSGLAPE